MKFPFLALILAIFIGTYVTVPQFEQELNSQYHIRAEQLDYSLNIAQNMYQPYEDSFVGWGKESRDRITELSMNGYVQAKVWLSNQSILQNMIAYVNSFHTQPILLAEKTILRKEEQLEVPEKYYPIRNKVVEEVATDNRERVESTEAYYPAVENRTEKETPDNSENIAQSMEKVGSPEKEMVAEADHPAIGHSIEKDNYRNAEEKEVTKTIFLINDNTLERVEFFEKESRPIFHASYSKNAYVFATVSKREAGQSEASNRYRNIKADLNEKENLEMTIQLQKLSVKKPMTKKEREREEVAVQLAHFLAKKYMTHREREEVAMQLRQLVAKKQSTPDTGVQYTDMR